MRSDERLYITSRLAVPHQVSAHLPSSIHHLLSSITMSSIQTPPGVQVTGKGHTAQAAKSILTTEALDFLARMHRTFNKTRLDLLAARQDLQKQLDSGSAKLGFLKETEAIRAAPSWRCAPAGPGLEDRRVEITGPTDRKMVINALNSGAKTFMADFEDSNSPTWSNMVNGQLNLYDAVR